MYMGPGFGRSLARIEVTSLASPQQATEEVVRSVRVRRPGRPVKRPNSPSLREWILRRQWIGNITASHVRR